MKVLIHELNVFESKDVDAYRQLQRLFQRAAQGQHEVDVSDPRQVLSSDFWTTACAQMDRIEWEELVRRTLSASMFAPAKEVRHAIVSSKKLQVLGGLTAYSLLPSEVGEWAEQPLRVLLENARDGVLVRLAVNVSGSERLQESLEKGWLRPEGRGGSGEVKNAIKEAKVSHRLFVLIDSDRETPEGEISGTARGISRLCEGRFPLHILERREIENYVPGAVWELIVADLPRSKSTRASGVEHRAVLVYRWLLRVIEREQELAAKYGRDALDLVTSNLQRKAERALPDKFFHELLAEWKALTPKARGVDDMKVRFGRGYAETAVQKLSDENFDLSWIDAEALEELCSIARKMEDWL